MKRLKKYLVLLSACVLLLCMLALCSLNASALTEGGSCGDKTSWSLNYDTGSLVISGKGAIRNGAAPDYAPWYKSAAKVKSIVIKSGVTAIGSWAFESCLNAKTVSLPKTLTSIGMGAFYNCISLTEISLPAQLTSIGNYAFCGCSGLTSIKIPSGITSIKKDTFNYCAKLQKVTLPLSLKSLDVRAFNICPKLSSFSISAENDYFTTSSGVLFNKTKTSLLLYPAGKGSTSYTVPKGVTTIGTGAFRSATKLKNLVFPATLKTIESEAFKACDGLTKIILPKSVTAIKTDAFYSANLMEINITNRSCTVSGGATTLNAATIYAPNPSKVRTYVMGLYDEGEDDLDYNFVELGSDLLITGLSHKYTSKTVTLSWNGIAGADKYEIYGFAGGIPSLLETVTTPAITIDALPNLHESTYIVKAMKVSGDTVIEGKVSSPIDTVTGPAKVSGELKAGKLTSTSFTLSWSAVKNAEGYIVYIIENAKQKKVVSVKGTSVSLTKLPSGGSPTYCVRAYVKRGGKTILGDSSKKLSVNLPLKKIGTPKWKKSTSATVTLSWGTVTGAKGYRVYQYKDGSWKKLADTASTSYTVKKLDPGKSHSFRVRAYKEFDSKRYYNDLSATLKAYTAPSAPTDLYASAKKATSVTLRWNCDSTVSGYQVFLYKSGKWVNVKSCKTKSTTVPELKKSTSYHFKVRAYRIINDVTYFGDYSKAITVKTASK